ncbi:hypothetical protein Vretimale_19957, partial [Volvox reticuliferus]
MQFEGQTGIAVLLHLSWPLMSLQNTRAAGRRVNSPLGIGEIGKLRRTYSQTSTRPQAFPEGTEVFDCGVEASSPSFGPPIILKKSPSLSNSGQLKGMSEYSQEGARTPLDGTSIIMPSISSQPLPSVVGGYPSGSVPPGARRGLSDGNLCAPHEGGSYGLFLMGVAYALLQTYLHDLIITPTDKADEENMQQQQPVHGNINSIYCGQQNSSSPKACNWPRREQQRAQMDAFGLLGQACFALSALKTSSNQQHVRHQQLTADDASGPAARIPAARLSSPAALAYDFIGKMGHTAAESNAASPSRPASNPATNLAPNSVGLRLLTEVPTAAALGVGVTVGRQSSTAAAAMEELPPPREVCYEDPPGQLVAAPSSSASTNTNIEPPTCDQPGISSLAVGLEEISVGLYDHHQQVAQLADGENGDRAASNRQQSQLMVTQDLEGSKDCQQEVCRRLADVHGRGTAVSTITGQQKSHLVTGSGAETRFDPLRQLTALHIDTQVQVRQQGGSMVAHQDEGRSYHERELLPGDVVDVDRMASTSSSRQQSNLVEVNPGVTQVGGYDQQELELQQPQGLQLAGNDSDNIEDSALSPSLDHKQLLGLAVGQPEQQQQQPMDGSNTPTINQNANPLLSTSCLRSMASILGKSYMRLEQMADATSSSAATSAERFLAAVSALGSCLDRMGTTGNSRLDAAIVAEQFLSAASALGWSDDRMWQLVDAFADAAISAEQFFSAASALESSYDRLGQLVEFFTKAAVSAGLPSSAASAASELHYKRLGQLAEACADTAIIAAQHCAATSALEASYEWLGYQSAAASVVPADPSKSTYPFIKSFDAEEDQQQLGRLAPERLDTEPTSVLAELTSLTLAQLASSGVQLGQIVAAWSVAASTPTDQGSLELPSPSYNNHIDETIQLSDTWSVAAPPSVTHQPSSELLPSPGPSGEQLEVRLTATGSMPASEQAIPDLQSTAPSSSVQCEVELPGTVSVPAPQQASPS